MNNTKGKRMYYKISKFLTIGILSCGVQFMDSLSASNVSEENNNQIVYNNNTTNVNNYSFNIPTYYEKEVSAEEVKEFLENLRTNPSALVNAKFQLYSLKDYILPDVLKRLDAYLTELSYFRSTDLDYSYQVKISNSPNDLSIKFVALINQYLDNVISPVSKHYKEMPDRAYFEKDVWKCYCTVITKIIRGVNLVEKLISQKEALINEEKTNLPKKNNNRAINIVTPYNSNGKCWFVSTFQLFITAFNQSDPKDPIRKTNFAKFINHLHNIQKDFVTKIIISNDVKANWDATLKELKRNDLDRLLNDKWNKLHNLTRDNLNRDYLINIIGAGRIDIFSELILWFSKHEELIKTDRQREALKFIEQMHDVFKGNYPPKAVAIVLILFPELQKYFGSFFELHGNNTYTDSIMHYTKEVILDNDKVKQNSISILNNKIKDFDASIQNEFNKLIKNNSQLQQNPQLQTINISKKQYDELKAMHKGLNYLNTVKENNKIFKDISLSSFNDFEPYNDIGYRLHLNLLSNEYNITFNSTKYLLLHFYKYNKDNKKENADNLTNLVQGKRYITFYNKEGRLELYELIGMQLTNGRHAVCFAKTSKSDVSWSGIDSSTDGNDDNYALNDILYDNNQLSNNTYLAKIYNFYNYTPKFALYKKVSENEVNTTNKDFIKLSSKKLLQFEQWAYKILKEEYADDVMESDQNDSDIIFAYKQILSNIRNGQNSKEMYEILNNKNYNKNISDIIKNIISKIKEENNNKHSTINKES